MDLSKMPTKAKQISSIIAEKLQKNDTKEGVNLVEFARNLAKRTFEKSKNS